MTKKEIVRAIAEEVGLTQEQTRVIVQKTFDSIIETLVRDRRIELRNFGVFEVKTRAERKARNPRTGQEVKVPQRCAVSFKPGKVMEAKIAGLEVIADDLLPADPSAADPSSGNDRDRSPDTASTGLSSAPSGRWDLD